MAEWADCMSMAPRWSPVQYLARLLTAGIPGVPDGFVCRLHELGIQMESSLVSE